MFRHLCPQCINIIPKMLNNVKYPCPLLDSKKSCKHGDKMSKDKMSKDKNNNELFTLNTIQYTSPKRC